CRIFAQPATRFVESLRGAVDTDLRPYAAPDLGLPDEVAVEHSTSSVGVVAAGPRPQHVWAVGTVRGEQSGELLRDRHTATIVRHPASGLVDPEVPSERRRPRLRGARVDDLQ